MKNQEFIRDSNGTTRIQAGGKMEEEPDLDLDDYMAQIQEELGPSSLDQLGIRSCAADLGQG